MFVNDSHPTKKNNKTAQAIIKLLSLFFFLGTSFFYLVTPHGFFFSFVKITIYNTDKNRAGAACAAAGNYCLLNLGAHLQYQPGGTSK